MIPSVGASKYGFRTAHPIHGRTELNCVSVRMGLFWCWHCGRYAAQKLHRPGKPCRDKLNGYGAQNLARIRQGRTPNSQVKWPRPENDVGLRQVLLEEPIKPCRPSRRRRRNNGLNGKRKTPSPQRPEELGEHEKRGAEQNTEKCLEGQPQTQQYVTNDCMAWEEENPFGYDACDLDVP